MRAGARRMLEQLIERSPQGYSREELAEVSEIAYGSGTYATYLGDLRRNGLLTEEDGQVYASDALFLGE